MCESYVQAYSNPCCSASFISSIIRWYGGSGRTVTPKLSIDPPRSLAGDEHTAAKTPRTVTWPYVLFAFAAGVALPVQFGINAQLAAWLHSPIRAAFVSFLTGAIILSVAAALVFKPWPSLNRLGHAPGGSGSVAPLARSTWPDRSSPRPSSAPPRLISVIVAGQALSSLAVDHFGWVGFEQKQISAGRIAGMVLVGAGVALVRIF